MPTRNYQPIRRTLDSGRPVSKDAAGNATLVRNGYCSPRASLVMSFVITASEWEMLLAELSRSYGLSPFSCRGRLNPHQKCSGAILLPLTNLNLMEPVGNLMQKPMTVCRQVLSR